MQNDTEQRMAAVALVVAGVCFLLYPAIRPFADEDSLAGAEAFASGAWLIAHLLAVLDREAEIRGINRQALIKTWLYDRLMQSKEK
jgi:hypothetical protein